MKTPTSSLLKLQMQKNDGRLIKWSHLPFAVNILLNLPDDPERAIISGLVHPCCWISLEDEEGGKPTSTESEGRAGSNYPPYLEKQSHKHQPFMKQYGKKMLLETLQKASKNRDSALGPTEEVQFDSEHKPCSVYVTPVGKEIR